MKQINLYQLQFRPRRASAVLRSVKWVALLLGLVLVAGVAWQQFDLRAWRQRVRQETVRQQQLTAELETLQQKLAAHHPSALLEQQVLRLRQQLEVRRPQLAELRRLIDQGDEVTHVVGALAQLRHHHVALTEISVRGSGQEMGLRGEALTPRAVTDFVEEMTVLKDVRFRSFEQLQLDRSEDGRYLFLLRSHRGDRS
ncbi:MAG: hypothetical protein JXR59_05780 [Desulfuromonadaceae bacterium]|nr:hypothetical protein [Desulfuromonadaceae bacterium]